MRSGSTNMNRGKEKSPPEAGLSLISYDDEGGITPRPHAPFNMLFTPFDTSLSTHVRASLV